MLNETLSKRIIEHAAQLEEVYHLDERQRKIIEGAMFRAAFWALEGAGRLNALAREPANERAL